MLSFTDPNGTVHAYSYDVLARLTSDAVTTLGTIVDDYAGSPAQRWKRTSTWA